LTYIVAEAQLLVAGLLVSTAILIIWYKPAIPGVPPIVTGWLAITLLLGPPLFGFFVWLIHKVRSRDMVAVYHVNAVTDELKKYYVEPSVWQNKDIDGPNPYPVNGASGWAVQEFDHDEELGLTVKGVWLEETEDVKLLSDKSHMRSIYGKLTESHIALQIFRDSVSEFGAEIQGRLINTMAEARERGKMMDKSAVKDVFGDFEDKATGMGPDDLPTLEPEDGEQATEEIEDGPEADAQLDAAAESAAEDALAADGGSK
jgi:hypothetical protein